MSMNYEKRLQIPIEGNPDTIFTTESGLVVAKGYERIVIGKRGPYIEFHPDQIEGENLHIPDDQTYRLENSSVYYIEYRTKDASNVKIYFQLKIVDYADYKIDFLYASPFDLLADGKVIIERVRNEKGNN